MVDRRGAAVGDVHVGGRRRGWLGAGRVLGRGKAHLKADNEEREKEFLL